MYIGAEHEVQHTCKFPNWANWRSFITTASHVTLGTKEALRARLDLPAIYSLFTTLSLVGVMILAPSWWWPCLGWKQKGLSTEILPSRYEVHCYAAAEWEVGLCFRNCSWTREIVGIRYDRPKSNNWRWPTRQLAERNLFWLCSFCHGLRYAIFCIRTPKKNFVNTR